LREGVRVYCIPVIVLVPIRIRSYCKLFVHYIYFKIPTRRGMSGRPNSLFRFHGIRAIAPNLIGRRRFCLPRAVIVLAAAAVVPLPPAQMVSAPMSSGSVTLAPASLPISSASPMLPPPAPTLISSAPMLPPSSAGATVAAVDPPPAESLLGDRATGFPPGDQTTGFPPAIYTDAARITASLAGFVPGMGVGTPD
jgi:hypothetical protein